MLSLTEQLFSFLVGIGIGLVLGFLYNIYRFLRGTFRIRRLGVHLGDFLYWLIATVVTFCVLLFFNNGEVRFYIFIAIAVGGIIYLSLLSLPCLQFMAWCLKGMNRVCRMAGKFYTRFFFRRRK
ncbi:MAG: hypothetical protein PWQ91_15 [Eubacteriales bacterium]|nr:hypothetical protein [Eubacteriales bacterium]